MRTNKAGQRLAAMVLFVIMVVGMMPVPAQAEAGENGMPMPTPEFILGTESSSPTIVAFGGSNWYVIGHNGRGVASKSDTITLLAVGDRFGTSAFNSSGFSYKGGDLHTTLINAFNQRSEWERALIVPRDIHAKYNDSGTELIPKQYFWPLSRDEVTQLNTALLSFRSNWWLRSATPYLRFADAVHLNGTVGTLAIDLHDTGVRPAVILNLKSIFFTSPVLDGGKGAAGLREGLVPITKPTLPLEAGAIKFTVPCDDLTLSCTDTETRTGAPGDTVQISYFNATITEPPLITHYISCIIVNSHNEVIYYGKLARFGLEEEKSGTVSFTIPDLSDGDYTIKLFSEKRNDNASTDFCSTPISIPLEVRTPEPTVTDVTVNPSTIEVQKGTTQQFDATVNGTNHPAQTVTWEVSDKESADTDITADGLLTVGADETAETLTVTATSTVDTSKSGTATVTVTNSPPIRVYSISLDPEHHTFPAALVGYDEQAAQTVTIQNTGDQPTGDLTISLSGTSSDAFEVSSDTVGSIAVEGTDSFTVVPKTGLAPGTYTATVTVSGDHSISASLNVSFTVVTDSPGLYTITFNANGGTVTPATAQTGADGKLTSLPTPARSGNYRFDGWYTAASGGTKVTTNTVFTEDQTIYAHWTYTGGSDHDDDDDDSGSDSGSSFDNRTTTPATTTSEKTPSQTVMAEASVTATPSQNGWATASIPEKSVTDAIAKAQADAKAQGKTANGTTVALNITMPKGATSLTANLTRHSLNSLVSAGVTSLALNGSLVRVAFDAKALAEIQKQSSGNISFTIAPNASLSSEAKKMIGTRPVYELTVSYTKNGKNATVSSWGGGTATVSVPYTPAEDEAVGGLYAVYVDAYGNATRVAGSAYDANRGCVIFTTTHFSRYGIGYTAPSAKFADIANHWAKESIDYVVGRGLLSGTTETTFAPDAAMTRGMLVAALGRLANVDVKSYTTNSFTDVKTGSALRPFIEWAHKKGVVQDSQNGKFEPERAVTREEVAKIFANYAKVTGYTLPVTRMATTYRDASSIGSAYKEAVTATQQAGILMGSTGNQFNPKSSATRAEVSSMLHRYIKLTIDPNTAQGWAKNDTGQYLYYKNGKPLTDTQTIGGAKYFFNADGTLQTGWVKDGDDRRFYSGNRMLVGFCTLGANGNKKTYYFTKDGIMVAGKWLQIDDKWYYFQADGSLKWTATKWTETE
jgi:uncharacterized repeat protein (TIGR02543 family)